MSEKFEKFTWTINNNFSVLVEFDKYQFVFGGYTWSISVAIDENRLMDFILDVVDWIQGHSITANFKFSVVNQRVDTLVKSIAIDFENTNKKDFVQLAEEACHKHPSVIECHKNKNHSSMFTKWGFIALGRVLHFLKTKKVKDMNDEGCKELQVLWKEVIAFGFDDLAWLEPHVKCALGMRNHKERTMHVKKMKENVAALEVDLKVAREELVKAEEGFEERDLNDVLGY
ncbi:hypothetical protein S83_005806 [Arachis hypogaea]|nr:uncharacterized protein DS421_12g387940 [Arachis hypogaea]